MIFSPADFFIMRKFTFGYLNPIAFFLISAFLFQSCKAYDKQDITIDNAIESNIKRIKVITLDNRKFFFDSLYYSNNTLYGRLLKSKKHPNVEMIIPQESIKEIQLYNQKKSLVKTVVLLVSIGGIYLISVVFINQY